jgi:hypothetical protein
MANEKYKFFLSKDNATWVDIEDNAEWKGEIRYMSCKGLETIGKPKNKYTESYADAQELRVYEADEIFHEATDVTFTFIFVGENRKQVYASFYDYVKNGKFYYYDTARWKKAYLVLLEAVDPSEDDYKGGTPYMKAEFKFKNLWGRCIDMKTVNNA